MQLEVSIVTHQSATVIAACLESVLAGTAPPARVTVVDNASTDGTLDVVARYPHVRGLRNTQNRGYGAAHNLVLAETPHPLVLLLNPDARLDPDCVSTLCAALEARPDVAAAGPRLERPGGRPEVSFGPFPGWSSDLRQRRRVHAVERGAPAAVRRLEARLAAPFLADWVSGACMLVRTDAVRRTGLFDEAFFLYLEDVDLCRRLRDRGARCLVEPRARCVHVGGASHDDPLAARRAFRASRLLYERKHGSRIGAWLYRNLRT